MASLYQIFRSLADFAGNRTVTIDLTDDQAAVSISANLDQKQLRHIALCLKEHDDRAAQLPQQPAPGAFVPFKGDRPPPPPPDMPF